MSRPAPTRPVAGLRARAAGALDPRSGSAAPAAAPAAASRHARAWLATALLFAGALGAASSACSGGGGGGDDEQFGLESRVLVTTLALPTGQAPVGAVALTAAFPSLNRNVATGAAPAFSSPVFLAAPPDGSNRVVVVEQGGRILVFPNDPNVTRAQVEEFLVVTGVNSGGEKGLLGLAFSPDYATSGELYVHSTRGPDSALVSRIARFRRSAADPDRADPASEEVVLEVGQPFTNHNSGMLAFGPDGMLYVGFGDGGSAGDPQNRAQDLGSLLGKLLRIDVRGQQTYAVPADNPFVGVAGARGEIYAFGLRNPWRFSFDRLTGQIWLGDVGQNQREEIDLVERGANLGWRVFEGNFRFRQNEQPLGGQADAPVTDYTRALGNAVVGGYVYRGARHPSLVGTYFYADNGSGRVFALLHDGQQVIFGNQVASANRPSSFGEDEAGELYLVSHAGDLFRVEPAQAPPPASSIPARLSQTGIFADLGSLTANPGIIEYEVNAALWSDGARKRRWLALPGVSRIGFAREDPWTFPVGTVLVKHFEVELVPGDPASIRRLETRVLVHRTSGWEGYTYRWNPPGTDADLLTQGEDEVLTVGGVQQTWRYPSSAQCLECHTDAAGRVLGIHTRQLNRTFEYAARPDNQLRAFAHIGLFDQAIGDASALPRFPDPLDADAPLADRARAYLDANCAQCHRAGGPTPVDLDLRAGVAESDMRAIGVAATNGLGLPGGLRIRPGEPQQSVLWNRMQRTDGLRMPPLGTHVADPTGLAVVEAWIDALP